jgi:hypothetical protein
MALGPADLAKKKRLSDEDVTQSPPENENENNAPEFDPYAGYGSGGFGFGPGGGTNFSFGATSPPAPTVTGTDGSGNQHEEQPYDPIADKMQQIIDLAKATDAENRAAIEEFIGQSIPELEKAVASANSGDRKALKQLTQLNSQMGDIELPEYSGPALSSKEDRQRQLDAYGMQGEAAAKFKSLSDPSLTAEERYMMEVARLEEEGSLRGQREAALSELGARGARSGGADMAAILGAQQTTSQNRALSDLGAQANAQQRAMLALQGYGNTTAQMSQTAGQMSDASDVMSRFNKQQADDWSQWETDTKIKQQENEWGRGRDMFDATTYTTSNAYDRERDVYGANRDATAMKTGQYSAGASQIQDAIGQALGLDEARRAEAALNKKEKWKPGDPILLDKIL